MNAQCTVNVKDLLAICVQNCYSKLAAYLRCTYRRTRRSNFDTTVEYVWLFERLVKANKVKETRQLLDTYKDHIQEDCASSILNTAVRGDPRIFQHTLNILKPDVVSRNINGIFKTIYNAYRISARDNKIKIVIDGWADYIEYALIEKGMIKYCIDSYSKKTGQTVKVGHIVQMIVEKSIDRIEGQGIQIAMAACCVPQNLALMDALFDRNLGQIRHDPPLMNHALLRCCLYRDIDTFAHILDRCGSCICVSALEFWCSVGDLEAISMILGISIVNEELVGMLHKVYQKACAMFDVELAECLIRYTEQHSDIELDPYPDITVRELVIGGDISLMRVPSTHWIRYKNASGVPYNLRY